MDPTHEEIEAWLATAMAWETTFLFAEGSEEDLRPLSEAVGVRALRLEELAGQRGLLPVPEAERGSQIAQDDDRDWARKHGDLTVEHQVASRLLAAFDHLTAHSEGWRVRGDLPPFHVYPEFTVLRSVLESAAAAWWLLEPDGSSDRVRRALASKSKEAHYESQAAELKVGPEVADDLRQRIRAALSQASLEVGSDPIPKFPQFSQLADGFGGPGRYPSVGIRWRECSSYAHGFDWAAWHHRDGMVQGAVAFIELAEIFLVACDALHAVWTELWLPLALADPIASPPLVFLPDWPLQPDPGGRGRHEGLDSNPEETTDIP